MSASTEFLNDYFTEAYNALLWLYYEGGAENLRQCIAGARKLLDQPVVPAYHGIKTLLLLASTVADCEEAWEFHQKALTKWQVARRCNPEGQDEGSDIALGELWEILEEVGGVLGTERAEAYDAMEEEIAADQEARLEAELELIYERARAEQSDDEALRLSDGHASTQYLEETSAAPAGEPAATHVDEQASVCVTPDAQTGARRMAIRSAPVKDSGAKPSVPS